MRAYASVNESRVERVETDRATASATPETSASHAFLRACFELFHSTSTGLAKLSIETSNDLFEMEPLVTPEQVYQFRSKRGEWLTRFDAALRELFERRMGG